MIIDFTVIWGLTFSTLNSDQTVAPSTSVTTEWYLETVHALLFDTICDLVAQPEPQKC